MPTGPHRFGCGEIATGFKTGGFPPCFFCHPRVVPKPPGPPIPPNGGPGGPDPWECYTEPGQCPTNQNGTVVDVFCRQATCDPADEGCYATEAECENDIGLNGTNHPGGPAGCERIYDCEEDPWTCVQNYENCPPPDTGLIWTRSCQQVPVGTPFVTLFDTEALCQGAVVAGSNVGCADENLCGIVTPTTRWRCVVGTQEFCTYPPACASTGGNTCFDQDSSTPRNCVECNNCVETVTGGPFPTTTVTCDEDPAVGPPVCVHLNAADCGLNAPCVSDPPCPVQTTGYYCLTTLENMCAGPQGEPISSPTHCAKTPFCWEREQQCNDCTCWTVDPGGANEQECCCDPNLGSGVTVGTCGECTTTSCDDETCPDATGVTIHYTGGQVSQTASWL